MLEFPAHHLDSHHISNLNLCVSNAKVFLLEGTTGSLQNTRAGESVNRAVCCHRAGRLLGCLSRMSLHVPHRETPGFLHVFSGVIAASVVPSVSQEGCASSPAAFSSCPLFLCGGLASPVFGVCFLPDHRLPTLFAFTSSPAVGHQPCEHQHLGAHPLALATWLCLCCRAQQTSLSVHSELGSVLSIWSPVVEEEMCTDTGGWTQLHTHAHPYTRVHTHIYTYTHAH